ncbi:MAG TPA: hypothetical protein VGK13_06400 [Methanocellaceae archaeon]|jgi:predicted transglutaminase-like cysteine proteinase
MRTVNTKALAIFVVLALVATVCGCISLSSATGSQFSIPHASYTPTMTTTVEPEASAVSASPSAFPMATAAPTAAITAVHATDTPSVTAASDTSEMLQRNFTWVYKDVEWHYNAKVSENIYAFYRNKPHDWTTNYANYALSGQDRPFLQEMANQFKKVGADNGFSQYDDAMIVAIFVQSLPYTDDLTTTGQAEYPRYPLETIVDNGGDCEDKAILASALLHEMGYDVVLLKFPDHMAVGVDLPAGVSLPNNEPPMYYDYHGKRYYYLETSDTTWDIGQIPDELRNAAPKIYLMAKDPTVEMDFSTTLYSSDLDSIQYSVHCTVKNDGPGVANNVKVHMMALAPERGADQFWLPDQQFVPGDLEENQTISLDGILKIPRDHATQIEIVASGDNIESLEQFTDSFST